MTTTLTPVRARPLHEDPSIHGRRWFLLAIVCELVSLVAFGLSRRRLLRADGAQARFSSVMAITYAGNALSMSIPFVSATASSSRR